MEIQKLPVDWKAKLEDELKKPYYHQLLAFLQKEYSEQVIFPPKDEVFNALYYTPFHNVKVVILGQDPYHGAGQAHGLSFSVTGAVRVPPSLRNMFKELQTDLGIVPPTHGNLTHWAREGVLLLNTVLTVREGQAASHRKQGWEQFTNAIIERLSEREQPIVFILWGKHAQEKKKFIDTNKHFIIESVHPSPLSAHRGFFGSKPFSKTNEYLRSIGSKEIDWRIPEL